MTGVTMPAPIFANGTYSAEQMQAYGDARAREMVRNAALMIANGFEIGVAEEPELQHQLFGTS